MFDSSGLSEDLLAIYKALLQRPELGHGKNLNELAAELGRPVAEISRDMQRLRDLGFVAQSFFEGFEYPLDPAVTFGRLAASRQQEIDDLSAQLRNDQLAASKFTADLANFLVRRTTSDVEVLHGRELANQRMQRFRPEKSMWGFIQDSTTSNWNPEAFPDRNHLERGVAMRYLFSESYWKRSGAREILRYIMDLGGKIRITPSIPFRMIIFDSESVVMGIDPEDNAVGAVVHHSRAVVRMATELYLSHWDRAFEPFADEQRAQNGGISAQEAEFLRLLVHGATDEQVGRKLGVSLRTVRRIAAKLSEQVGASGRFELGVRAAQRGWVD